MALAPGRLVRVISPASPADPAAVARGVAELRRLGYRVRPSRGGPPDGYFAAPLGRRRRELRDALLDEQADAIVCARGGYGAATLLDGLELPRRLRPKLLIGFSDVTMLHAFLWRRLGWPSLYGPMAAAGFDRGAGKPGGYDRESFLAAAGGEKQTWDLKLRGETLRGGEAAGRLLGGCLTLVQATLGTPWELDTRGAILLLEDRGVRPYQVDRMLVHLAQAGKLADVRGFLLGDFPDSAPPRGSRVTVRDVCRRLLAPLGVPVVFGAPVGHTERPMLTVPLGARVRLHARGAGLLEILEPVVSPPERQR